jgi:mycothiol S-conjugate amidase
MLIYPANQSFYPHPDHLRVHEVGLAAFHSAADPSAFPEAGPPWQVQKVYYNVFSRRRRAAIAAKFAEVGIDVPWLRWDANSEEQAPAPPPEPEDEVTTEVDVSGFGQVRNAALKAHATQVDPNSPYWFGLPEEAVAELGYIDEYHLAVNLTTSQPPEDDLFSGVRETASL